MIIVRIIKAINFGFELLIPQLQFPLLSPQSTFMGDRSRRGAITRKLTLLDFSTEHCIIGDTLTLSTQLASLHILLLWQQYFVYKNETGNLSVSVMVDSFCQLTARRNFSVPGEILRAGPSLKTG